jgi:hypothetical protein
MIKISIEYTIIDTTIFEVIPEITIDKTTTVIEKIMAESLKILTENGIKEQKKVDISNITDNIGKQ